MGSSCELPKQAQRAYRHHADQEQGEHRAFRPEGAPGQPRGLGVVAGADPDVLLDVRGLLGLEVHRAVLEPEEVPWRRLARRGGRGAAEPELRPADRHGAEPDARQVADEILKIVKQPYAAFVSNKNSSILKETNLINVFPDSSEAKKSSAPAF